MTELWGTELPLEPPAQFQSMPGVCWEEVIEKCNMGQRHHYVQLSRIQETCVVTHLSLSPPPWTSGLDQELHLGSCPDHTQECCQHPCPAGVPSAVVVP